MVDIFTFKDLIFCSLDCLATWVYRIHKTSKFTCYCGLTVKGSAFSLHWRSIHGKQELYGEEKDSTFKFIYYAEGGSWIDRFDFFKRAGQKRYRFTAAFETALEKLEIHEDLRLEKEDIISILKP